MLLSCEHKIPYLLMGASGFEGDGERENDYWRFWFTEGVATDLWDIWQRSTYSEDRNCFYSRSYFESFREDLDRKENSSRQNLELLAWTSVIPGDCFFCEIFWRGGGGVVRPRLVQVPQNYHGVQVRPQGALGSPEVLGPDHHGGQGRSLLWPSLQEIPRRYLGRPPVPYALQRGCVCRHSPLVGGGGDNIGGHGGTWSVHTVVGGILLCRKWTCHVNPTRDYAAVVWRSRRPLWSGRHQEEYTEDGEHGLASMPHAW